MLRAYNLVKELKDQLTARYESEIIALDRETVFGTAEQIEKFEVDPLVLTFVNDKGEKESKTVLSITQNGVLVTVDDRGKLGFEVTDHLSDIEQLATLVDAFEAHHNFMVQD